MQGWRMSGQGAPLGVVLEGFFAEEFVGERARLFWTSAMAKMREARLVRDLTARRGCFVTLFFDDVLQKCMQWTNEHILVHNLPVERIKRWDMYRFFSVVLLSHTAGLSLQNSIEILNRLVTKHLSLERIRFIVNNIKSYSVMGRGTTGESSWNSQRDHTVQLGGFEQAAFQLSCRMFLNSPHTILTLDDDLYGTRASDKQAKVVSSRKAHKERHFADSLADPFSRLTLFVRFRRRGKSQTSSVDELLSMVLKDQGTQSHHGVIVTAYRGYGKLSLLRSLLAHEIGSLFVMPEHLLHCHPFVGRSFLQLGRFDQEEDEEVDIRGEDVSSDGRELEVDQDVPVDGVRKM